MRTLTVWMLVFTSEFMWAAGDTTKYVNVLRKEGGSLDLQCPYECSEKDKDKYRLCKVDHQHECTDVIKRRTTSTKKGNQKRVLSKCDRLRVVISDLRRTDSGVYRCQTKRNRPVVEYGVTVLPSDVNRGTTLATPKGKPTKSSASSIPARMVPHEITSNSVQSADTASDKVDPQKPASALLRTVLVTTGLFGLIFLGALCAWVILRNRRKSVDAELLKTEVSDGESSHHPYEELVNPPYVAAEIAAAKEQATFYTMIGHVKPSKVPEHFYEEIRRQYSDINSPTPPTLGQQAIDILRNGSELHNTTEDGGYSLVMAPVERQGVL